MDELSEIGHSTEADTGNKPHAMTKSDVDRDAAKAVVAHMAVSRSRAARFEFSYMLNIHITYSIHPVCPHMYSHSLVSHHHSSPHFIQTSPDPIVVLKQCLHRPD